VQQELIKDTDTDRKWKNEIKMQEVLGALDTLQAYLRGFAIALIDLEPALGEISEVSTAMFALEETHRWQEEDRHALHG